MNTYQVVDTNTNKAVAEGFAKREDAKVKRDELNGGKPTSDAMPRHIVSRGSEHPNGATNGISTQMLGKNRWI